jgi:hypothetical protein
MRRRFEEGRVLRRRVVVPGAGGGRRRLRPTVAMGESARREDVWCGGGVGHRPTERT